MKKWRRRNSAVPVRDDGVVVVALENVQELREDREVAGGVFAANRTLERIEREQVVEVVGGAQVERFAFLKRGNLAGPLLQGGGEGMRGAEPAAKLNDGVVHVGGEFGHCAAHLSAPVAVPAEQYRETGNEVTDLRDLEVRAGAGAKRGNAIGLEGGEIRAAVIFTYAV